MKTNSYQEPSCVGGRGVREPTDPGCMTKDPTDF